MATRAKAEPTSAPSCTKCTSCFPTGNYRRVLEAKPSFAEARLALVRFLTSTKALEEARRELAPLLIERADNPRVQETLGDVEYAAGNRVAATAAYERASSKTADPEKRHALERKRRAARP